MAARIAIAVSRDEGLESPVDPRFGRAAAFVLTDETAEEVEVLVNPNVEAAHGAGTGSAAMLVRAGVTAVIAGEFGPKAYQGLEGAGIAMWIGVRGKTARELLAMLGDDELEPMKMQVFR